MNVSQPSLSPQYAIAREEARGDHDDAVEAFSAPVDNPDSLATRRLIDGGSFIHDAPDKVPALWGDGEDVLWSAGEPCLLVGPTGVGKTTLGAQIVAGRMGLTSDVLGYSVQPGRRVLYLAMDRPEQIRRALARLLQQFPRELLAERLTVWKGPPAADLAKHPGCLLALAQDAGADTVVLDSLKDAAVKLTDDEVGQGISSAMQHCVADGIEVLGYHHQRKRGKDESRKPASVDDVYGSTWITAGVGSVVVLWGQPGDPVVELSHIKQPVAAIGPMTVEHDHSAGTSRVLDAHDPYELLRSGPRSAASVASGLTGNESPSRAEVAKARRKLDKLVADGVVVKLDDKPERGGVHDGTRGGSSGTRYALSTDHDPDESRVSTHVSTHADPPTAIDARSHGRRTTNSVTAGQTTHVSTHATHAQVDARGPTPLKGGPRRTEASIGPCDRCGAGTNRPPDDSGRRLCQPHAYPAGVEDDEP